MTRNNSSEKGPDPAERKKETLAFADRRIDNGAPKGPA